MSDKEMREIEAIKDRLRSHLNGLAEIREVVLRDEELRDSESVRTLFKFADQLNNLLLSGFDIDHPMMPDVITALVALVSGISKGVGTDELRYFMAFQEKMDRIKGTSMH